MHPVNHIWTSGLAVLITGVYLQLGFSSLAFWLAIGITATIAIDIDHLVILIALRKRLGKISMDAASWNGKFLQVRNFYEYKMTAHILQAAAVSFLILWMPNMFLIPVIISMMVHILADISPDFYLHAVCSFLMRNTKTCMSCGSTEELEIHGNMSKTLRCLALCRGCHARIHKLPDPYGNNMISILDRYNAKKA